MPFASRAQRAYLFKHHPEVAKRWAAKYGVKVQEPAPKPKKGKPKGK